MSCDFFVYSESGQAVSRSELTSAMRAVGWDIVFVDDFHKMSLAQGDRVSEYEIIVGWETDPEVAAKVQGLLANRDREGLEKLFEEMTLGGCEIYVNENERDEDEECIPDDIRPDHRRALENAKLSYYLRTAAGRSPLSFVLQDVVWRAIGKVTRGLVEDPQTGKYCFAHELPPPNTVAEVFSALKPQIPWSVIQWHFAIAAVGLAFGITGRIPVPRYWLFGIMCIYGLLAYGLSLGHKWVWQVAVVLSIVVIVLSGYGGLFGGLGFAAIPIIAFNAYLLYQLLLFDTRLYYDAV